MSRSAEFAAGTGRSPYTVVAFHGQDKPRMKVHGRYAYDEDAAEAARKVAESSTAWPNQEYPDTHPQHGEYSHGVFTDGNKMAAVYLKGDPRYRS